MSKWYQGKNGWEEGFQIIDLGYDGSFTAGRRKVMEGRVLYDGTFWNATTDEKTAAYLDILFQGDNINQWIHAEVLPRHYEIYQDTQEKIFHLFIIDQGYLEFYAAYADPADLYQDLRKFNQTGIAKEGWEVTPLNDASVWKQLRQCRRNDRLNFVVDLTGSYLKKQIQ